MLIIDTDVTFATSLAKRLTTARPRLDVRVEGDFLRARTRLRSNQPELLVTALQLREYNGLHLVHLVAAADPPTRSLVYTERIDPGQAREIRAAGAFFEVRSRLPVVLPGYVSAVLPPQDRRDPTQPDRRALARGGRRAADHHISV